MTKDIRGDNDPIGEFGPAIDDPTSSMDWAENLPDPETLPDKVGMKADLPTNLINPNTNQPVNIQSNIVHDRTLVEKLWDEKRYREPCYLCEHFKEDAISRDEKILFWKNLIKDHGWSKRAVKDDLGNPDNFALCDLYESLTHRMASCPRGWRARKTLLRIFGRTWGKR